MELYSVIVAVIVVLVSIPLLQRLVKWRRFVVTIDKIPGPRKYPIIGTAYESIGLKRTDVFEKFFVNRVRDYPGGISRIWMLYFPEIRLTKPEFVEKVLSNTKNLSKSIGYEVGLKMILGNGLVTASGEHWFTHRKVITPTFHFSILEGFTDVFAEKCDILKRKIAQFSNTGEAVDVYPLISNAALDIICETAMGIKMNAQDTGENEYIKSVTRLAELNMKRFLNPFLHNDFIFFLTAMGRQCKVHLNTMHEFTDRVIAERKALRKGDKSCEDSESGFEDLGQKKRKAFLDLLLDEAEKREFFTDKDIREEVDTFIFAGHDTTAASTGWALFMLGHHPEVQEKLWEEQKNIFGESNRLPTFKDLSEMKYMDRVMKECIRIYPTVVNVARRVTEEFEVGGYTIPVGAMVGISIWGCSRDERYFPDPERFDPDRWLPENSQNRHPYSHIPFSAGPRNCIGMKFAQTEEKVMLSTVIRNFTFVSVDSRKDIKIIPEIVARPYPGIRLVLKKRV